MTITIAVHPEQTGLLPSGWGRIKSFTQRLANRIEIEDISSGLGEHQDLFKITSGSVVHRLLAPERAFVPNQFGTAEPPILLHRHCKPFRDKQQIAEEPDLGRARHIDTHL